MSGTDWQLTEFAQGRDAARIGRPSRLLTLTLVTAIALLAAAFVWASQARIEEVARTQGRVVPSGHEPDRVYRRAKSLEDKP